MASRVRGWVAIATVVAVGLVLALVVQERYHHRVLTLVFLWAAMGLAWNIISGYAGQISFGHQVFFGIGAYVTVLLVVKAGLTPWIGMVVAVGVAVLAAALLAIAGRPGGGQEANEDESKVPPYTLPDPLVLADGKKVTDARTWTEKRRPELLRLFETHVYGRTPAGGPRARFEVTKTDPSAVGGRAIRKDVVITFGDAAATRRMNLVVYLPAPQSGSPMTYLLDGKQYVVVAVSGGPYSGEYLAFTLPAESAKAAGSR